jgi:CDGSH iron-sulfur domain-containing protein 3
LWHDDHTQRRRVAFFRVRDTFGIVSSPARGTKQPYVVKLAPGAYYWCACGKSKRQPYCDGSHRSTLISPMRVEASDAVEVKLCGCKQSANKPYCDCTHEKL